MQAIPAKTHPLAINWMITYRCLRDCCYCLTDSGPAHPDELDAENRLRAVEILASIGVRRISVMGGEPFLLSELPAIGRCAWLHGITMNVTTSGFGCTAAKLAAMKDSLQYLNVSLDGPEEYHDRYRGTGSYRRAVGAIRAARGLTIPVRVYSVLTTENSDPPMIEWFFRSAREQSVMLIMFIFLAPTGRGENCSRLRVPAAERAAIRATMKSAAEKSGVRFKACDPYDPEEFKWFLDASGALYKHAGGGIHEQLGNLLQEPDGRAWKLLSAEEQETHWQSFSDLLPRLKITLPAVLEPPPGMAYIPPGVFQMGGDLQDHDKPVQPVYLDGFYMDRRTVTNSQFAGFLNAKGNQVECGIVWLDLESLCCLIEHIDGRFRAKAGFDNHPVVAVSWYGARAYAAWVGKRLPTEAEWEKAARGGLEGKAYSWGDTPPADQCNWLGYDGRYKHLRPDFYHGRGPLPVGLFPPNGYGLFDMSGNVWEWCADWHHNRNCEPDLRINPLATHPSRHKILRGGSWSFDPANLRVAKRSHADPGQRRGYDGFRCVISNIDLMRRGDRKGVLFG
jgi:formylglycine-generating enzyme required for sulfatase activity/MoaA/NifB/PqqE/SkfB family radical SAM enzyme